MRIGVDSRPLREKHTSGIPMFVRKVLQTLARIDKKNEYILYAHKDFQFDMPSKGWRKRVGAYTRYGSVWMQLELPFWLKQDKVDLFWGTQHILPLFMSSSIRSVLTVCDLIHFVFPRTMKPLNLLINKMIIPPSVRKSDAVTTISNWTLLDVKKFLKPKNKIMETIPLAISENFWPRDGEESKKKIKEIFGFDGPFLLTVGTFEPRKNIVGAFHAFSLIADKIPHRLVVVGQKGWKNETVRDEIKKSNLFDRIVLAGYVEDEDLPYIYSAADLFIFPSLYEGFGLPPLEAMACGIPVVASNVSSIPEVVGEAAVLVNPYDVNEIAEKILQVLTDSSLKQSLVQKGSIQAKKFNLEKTAAGMLDIFNRLEKTF